MAIEARAVFIGRNFATIKEPAIMNIADFPGNFLFLLSSHVSRKWQIIGILTENDIAEKIIPAIKTRNKIQAA